MEKRKIVSVIIIVLFVFFGFLIIARIIGGEDSWICENSQWIRHGNPSAPEPTSGCGITPKPEFGLTIDFPKENTKVSSPLSISGSISGNNWVGFEGQAGVVNLVDDNGNILSAAPLMVLGDWTKLPVNFATSLEFDLPESGDGWLIFYNENPSGLDENARQFEMPISFDRSVSQITVQAYFGNSNFNSSNDCQGVFPVSRMVPKTEAVARVAIEELLRGLSQEEKNNGFFTGINDGVRIQKLVIDNKVAKIDFSKELEKNIGGSCRVSLIRSQIEKTLKQFSTIQSVFISIDGRIDDILQP